MKTTFPLSKLVWQFNHAVRLRHQSFITKPFYGVQEILNYLYLKGWIVGYREYPMDGCLEVYLKYSVDGSPVLLRVENTIKPSLVASIRQTQLPSDTRLTLVSGFLRTQKYGFIESKSAFKRKSGGIYLVKFY